MTISPAPDTALAAPRPSNLTPWALFGWGVAVNLYYGRIGFMPLDQSIVFDGGYRLLSGQLPYRDFMAPAGLMPAALQALFFAVFGVTWFAYVLHAAVCNGLFAVLAFALLRLFDLEPHWAAWWAALSALTFYPPMGVPYLEHHAFVFCLCALVSGGVARRRRDGQSGRSAFLCCCSIAPLLAAAFFSKPNPTILLAPVACVLPLLGASRHGIARNFAGLMVGAGVTLAAMALYTCWLVPDLAAARAFAFDMPGSIGAGRFDELLAGRGPGWPLLRAAVRIWPSGSLLLAVVIAGRALVGRQERRHGRVAALLALALLAASLIFTATTSRSPATAAVYTFLIAGLAHASLGHSSPAVVKTGGLGAATLTMPLALSLLLLVAAAEALRFDLEVNSTRVAILPASSPDADTDTEPAAAAQAGLPGGLRYLRWRSLEAVGYGSSDLAGVVNFFQSHAGNFFLVGDSSILYGLTGRPSPCPVLWFHPYLTIPFQSSGRRAKPAFNQLLLRRLRHYDVRYLVLEGAATRMGVSLASFPPLRAEVAERRYGEDSFGIFRIISLRGAL